jgi:NitT/TauT family transport system ATP-binding protein
LNGLRPNPTAASPRPPGRQPGGAPLVTLRSVGKSFDNGVEALRNFSLEVREGEFLSLLGPSGCGKSTALRLIAGLSDPTAGTIEWRDGSPGKSAAEHEISFVFQDPTLMPWASVFDNIWLPFRLRGQTRDAARPAIEEAIALVGLDEFASAHPRELSGGMRMRVSIARALATKPRLLLMDEPFAALDEITRFKLNDELLELWRRQRFTVVFVTHSVFESVYLSSRLAVMRPRPGRVVEELVIDAPYPRTDDFRTSPLYNDYCRRVSDALSAAMAGA